MPVLAKKTSAMFFIMQPWAASSSLVSHQSLKGPLQGFGVRHVLNPDPYRGRHGNDGSAYAADVEDTICHSTSGAVAGFISESVQGVGGTVPLADGYLPRVYEVQIPKQSCV